MRDYLNFDACTLFSAFFPSLSFLHVQNQQRQRLQAIAYIERQSVHKEQKRKEGESFMRHSRCHKISEGLSFVLIINFIFHGYHKSLNL